jgi:hypothetical protein
MGGTMPQQIVDCKSMQQHAVQHSIYHIEIRWFFLKLVRNIFAGSI